MLKNKYAKIIFYSLICITITACEDFLSEIPDNRTIINSPEKVSQLIAGAYPNRNYLLMTSIMSDNVGHKGNANTADIMEEDLYAWEVPSTGNTDADSPAFYWESCYKAIAQANEALKAIEDLEGDYELSEQKGEALLARAYSHFMLVNLWSKHYDPSTSSSDLGVPYVIEPGTDFIPEYTRATVEEVYELIEKDIEEGLSLVGNEYDEPKFHFTKEAGYALAVRYYTFKGNEWDKVISYASNILSFPANEIRDDISYGDLTYSENTQVYSSQLEQSNLLVASPYSIFARRFARSRYGLTISKANELFFGNGGNPIRKSWAYRVFGNDQVYNLPKFDEYFRFTNQSAGIGQPYVGIVLFDKDEVLLNRAEAYAMKEDYGNSMNDLNAFLSKKTEDYDTSTDVLLDTDIELEYANTEYAPYYTITSKQGAFIKAISEFKRREYYHEGLRWFDIRRFNLKVEHEEAVEGTEFVLETNDLRKQLQIPQDALNSGITENPR